MILRQLFSLSLTMSFMSTVFAQSVNRERKLYVGSNSTEAKMTFSAEVEYEGSRAPTEDQMYELVESQIEHTIGPMAEAQYKAVPKGDHVISKPKILSQAGSTYKIGYTFKGTVVLENGPTTSYDIVLPVNPENIYEKGMVGSHNPCTDHHYQSEGDFWYFWNPKNSGCPLKKGGDYVLVSAKIERFKNTTLTYPEYHNLPNSRGVISIHVLFGLDDPEKSRDPLKSPDTNAEIYRDFRSHLIDNGYKSVKWTTTKINKMVKSKNGVLPHVETLTKGKIEYRFFFGATGIDEDSLAFHWFYKDAIENASIMLYGGHSGLGGHLDLASIENSLGTKIKFNTKRYQIFFFDSCTSYKYYNQQYFERKMTSADPNGTKKLEIFTNGLATYFHTMPESNRALAKAIDKAIGYAQKNEFVSYQTLAKQIDSDNLFGISGDEDNETPKPIQ